MDKRLAAGEVQKSDAIALQDIASKFRLRQRDRMPGFLGQPVEGEAAKIAARIAAAGHGEMTDARTAIPHCTERHLPNLRLQSFASQWLSPTRLVRRVL